jgi:hypothetical protein
MSKTLNRKKPGYTRNGEVTDRQSQCQATDELKEKTQANKKQAKIQRRIDLLKRRPGYVEPVAEAKEAPVA